MKPETFLISHSLFTREEFAAVLRSSGRADATVDSHLARWLRQGRILRIKRGVFIRLDEPGGATGPSPDYRSFFTHGARCCRRLPYGA